MFDWFRSSYDLGKPFTETTCQSKTFDEYYSGFLNLYWLDPSGNLWEIDEGDTYDVLESDEALLGLDWIPNGKHGRVKACQISKTVLVYPQIYKGNWNDWPECSLTFLNGKLQHYEARSRPFSASRISDSS